MCSLRIQERRRQSERPESPHTVRESRESTYSPESPESPHTVLRVLRVLTAPRSCNMSFQLRVNSPSGEEKLIRLCVCADGMKNVTVQQLKRIIQCVFQTGDHLELVFGAETLQEDSLLLSYGVRHMSRIQSVVKLPGAHLRPT